MTLRVLLADDEAIVRAGVRAVLAADPGVQVVAEAADGREAVDLVLRHRPAVALLDIRMPRLDGLSAAAEIHRLHPATAVIVLTTFDEDDYVSRAITEGVSGFLLKSGDPRELLAGVRAAASGGAYLSPRIAARVVSRMADGRLGAAAGARDRVEQLTDRERQVLAMIGRGLSNAEIAGRLYVVEGTVKAHVSALLTRLGVRNRVQAAIVAHQAGLS